MSDHQIDRIRELLDQTAPDPDLGPVERTTAVVRRGRAARRRTQVLAAGAVAAVVAAAVAVPQLVGDDGPTGAADPGQPVIAAPPCPAQPIDVTDATPAPALGADVVSARRCAATWDGDTGKRPAPDDQLTALTGAYAAAFAADVEALPAYELPAACASIMVMPSPWAIVVGLPDGESAVIGSTMTSCGAVRVGGVDRDAEQVLFAFLGNLQRQGANRLTAGQGVATCPDGADGYSVDSWNASFDLEAATSGALCYQSDPLGSPTYTESEGTLSADQLATVRDDLVANLTTIPTDGGMCIDSAPIRLLVLVDDDGDRTAFVDSQCTGEFQGARGYWQPSAAVENVIAEALGGAIQQ